MGEHLFETKVDYLRTRLSDCRTWKFDPTVASRPPQASSVSPPIACFGGVQPAFGSGASGARKVARAAAGGSSTTSFRASTDAPIRQARVRKRKTRGAACVGGRFYRREGCLETVASPPLSCQSHIKSVQMRGGVRRGRGGLTARAVLAAALVILQANGSSGE